MTGATTGGRKGKFQKPNAGSNKQVGNFTDQYGDSKIVKAFERYAAELTAKQDKHERIVKLSRDVTIQSKRIIFAIHALTRSSNVSKDVQTIQESLNILRETLFKSMAKELINDDNYQYYRAYTWGIQEYIEAVTFLHYVTSGSLLDLKEIVESLSFEINREPLTKGSGDESDKQLEMEKVSLFFPEMDYLHGLQDLTGELMRHCINCFSAYRQKDGNNSCDFVRNLFSGMLLLSYECTNKDFSKKLAVTRNSLEKMEMACYSNRVRGSETLPFQSADELNESSLYSPF